ncbi:glyceraldehyde 3-phosphate dehydrogenase NAD-binding domain-containing protein [Paenibacillus sp. ATY16]|uniref:type I glyceraldehyde-3-phosphate dehydrogenase n=1 Tax=Paenibacillus sp. ATY16 TaxID=1759312 RepID=UPI00200F4B5F|nr:glyceraldehyde 3-phosphate dehydrogenase NAD-binding domain-containing protein [Paenibacillus sp. ATY16]MCK9860808.1 aldehyde dehydrogenase [Paenibacillus sp. ATY16]
MSKIAIFGFGRIGRQLLRVALQEKLFVPYSISDIKEESVLAALFEVDTNYKRWPEGVLGREGAIIIGGREIRYMNSSSEVPNWGELGVELVIDCTGRAVTRPVAQMHLDRGAKRVLVSGPSKSLEDCDAVLLKGINLDSFDPDKHKIISMASCTTNALAPVVKLVKENYGIKYGLFSTVHSYTNTQSLTDQPMKDRRDSWAAAENIIPSSSGAAKALKFIWSDLQITGKAYRIPTRTGSIAELNLITEKPCSVQEINDMFRLAASEAELKGVLDVLEGEWASSRIVGDSHSSIIDLPLTQVQGGLLSVAAWYDNEWGYASRLAEVAAFLAAK